jgi:hypothetical protein
MVRSYLIENRIRFDSDSGSGGGGAGEGKPDRFNPSEMRAREQRFQDTVIQMRLKAVTRRVISLLVFSMTQLTKPRPQ